MQRAGTDAPPAAVEEAAAFPVDAFIIPEGAAHLPAGVGEAVFPTHLMFESGGGMTGVAASATMASTPDLVDTAPLGPEPAARPRSATFREQRAHDVADRLQALAIQLRQHGYEVLAQKSVRGDALDALLAGVIAGYLVAAE